MFSRKSVLREYEEYGLSVPEIVDKFSQWVSQDQYMILNRVKMKEYRIRDSRKNIPLTYSVPVESDYFALKCSKRGNDVYRHRVYQRFKGLASLIDKTVFDSLTTVKNGLGY